MMSKGNNAGNENESRGGGILTTKNIATHNQHNNNTSGNFHNNNNTSKDNVATTQDKINNSCDSLITNFSLRLHTSHCSSLSNESDLSLALERDLDCASVSSDYDEMPAFDIRNLSPIGRTPSPIYEDLNTPTRTPSTASMRQRGIASDDDDDGESPTKLHPNYVTLHDINAQISPPSDADVTGGGDTTLSRHSSLETIFEGVFLNTPQRQQKPNGVRRTPLSGQLRNRNNLMEKIALNRLQAGKENQSPVNQQQQQQSPRNSTATTTRCLTAVIQQLERRQESREAITE